MFCHCGSESNVFFKDALNCQEYAGPYVCKRKKFHEALQE
jgi:hypothetical protein